MKGRKMHDITPLVIVGLPLFLGLLDLLLYKLGGNEATISRVMLNHATNRPLVALSTAYSFGVLMGHFFFPSYEMEPPLYEVLARMCVVLSPTVYAMVIIYAGNGTYAAHKNAIEFGGRLWFAGYVIAASLVGGIAGHVALPQHEVPPELPVGARAS